MSCRPNDLIRRTYRGEAALRHVAAISQHHRIQASPGYRAAAEYVAERLHAAGLQATIRRYPADGVACFWTSPGFLEWNCEGATLHRLDEQGEAIESLCDFVATPTSLIQRSIPVEGDFEVVAPGGKGGKEPGDYEGLEVQGKLVLTNQPVMRVAELAVRERGAAGIIFDGMAAGGRSELDLPDARQYTSFWWAGSTPPDLFGFVLSPRQGRRLRAELADGKSVRVRAAIDSRFYRGSFEVVEAAIPGSGPGDQEVLLVSHLCHPLPGAHDNASGAGALIEMAAALAGLLAEGRLPPPRRGIRFLWVPEMTGTFAWLAEHEADVRRGRWIAGLNLDMVGADQQQSGSAWELISLPQAGAAFADHLLSWLREPYAAGQRIVESSFSAGSDHYILSDPTVDIPTPMVTQWPDRFYHTSADTPDKVSADSLARSGALAAVYAYWLATAGLTEAAWLGHLMVTRFAAGEGRHAAAAVEAATGADQETRRRACTDYHKANAFRRERMSRALETLTRLHPEIAAEVPALIAEAATSSDRQATWVRTALGAGEGEAAPPADEPWRAEARELRPRRLHPGPIDVGMVLQTMGRELRLAYWQLEDDAGTALHEGAALLQYWADGSHTVAEIADRVALETGKPVGEPALRYFKLLVETGLVEWVTHEPG